MECNDSNFYFTLCEHIYILISLIRGRPTITYIDTLLWDSGLGNVRDLENCIRDRAIWSQLSSRRLAGVDLK